MPVIAKGEFLFYKRSLKKYEDGDISVEDILTDPGEHIYRIYSSLCYFSDKPSYDKPDKVTEYIVFYNWLRDSVTEAGGIDQGTFYAIYDRSILDKISIEDIETENKH